MISSETVILASSSSDLTSEYVSVFWITLAALFAPLASAVTKKKIPDVVFLIAFGIIIGSHVLGLADATGGVALIKELGLGVLFLLAGYEINTGQLKSRQGGIAAIVWFICFVLGTLVIGISLGFSKDFATWVSVGIAISSTALGTLLPMLKNNGAAGTKLGDAFMIHGAVGELLPVFAMALLLSTNEPWMAVLILLLFMVIAIVSALLPHHAFAKIPGLRRTMAAEANTTSQTMLRFSMLMLSTLMMVAAVFDLDVVLGAFSAGIILRSLTPEGAIEPFSKRLEVLGFSFLIPLFFVASGMAIDISSVFQKPLALVLIVSTILVVRGVPVFLSEYLLTTGSGLKTINEKVQLGLYAAAGLPIIVAVTQVAETHELMSSETGSLLVTSGAVTVLIFPLLASTVNTIFPAHSNDDDGSKEHQSKTKKIARRILNPRSAKKSQRSELVKTGAIPLVKIKKKNNHR